MKQVVEDGCVLYHGGGSGHRRRWMMWVLAGWGNKGVGEAEGLGHCTIGIGRWGLAKSWDLY